MRVVPVDGNRADWPRLVANALGDVRKQMRGNEQAQTIETLTVTTIVFTPSVEPGSPVAGQTYFDSSSDTLRTWDGTAWNNHW